MAKKNKQKKRKGSGKSHVPVPVTHRKVIHLDEMLDRIYTKEDLSTTCLRQCTCCRVACPQMKFCEATSIIDHIWKTWSKEDRRKLLVSVVRYFYSDSLIKPCLMLKGKTCRVYGRRPLNCRLYGMWPTDSWEERVAMFSKSTDLPREKLPLNVQCTNVRRKPQECKECNGTGQVATAVGNGRLLTLTETTACNCCGGSGKFQPPPLTKEQISKLFEMLDQADTTSGISDLQVSTNWNYRTFHDWVLLKFWGKHALSQWTHIVLTTTPEQRRGIVEAFEQQADKLVV